MLSTYDYPEFEYKQSEEQQTDKAQRHQVVIIGGGPIGLTAALDCAAHGIKCVVLDDDNTVSIGSRALCYAKRPLEIWDRLGVAQPIIDKGVDWKIGKNYFKEELVYQFDLLPEEGHQMPAMVNLQQYYLEEYLVEACQQSDLIDLRWKHKVTEVVKNDDCVVLKVNTPDGDFLTEADWVIACDGANSDTREMLNCEFEGQFFNDQFLIADIVMKNDFPTERWFWFDPPFHPGQSVLLHREADDVWRIDFQLGRDADHLEWRKPEKVIPLLKQMLGEDCEFELEWVSVYRFACRRMKDFVHNRVIFAGDAAHQVSPFGARGANTGVADIDNLIWKLKLIIDGKAPQSLLNSYNAERIYSADENLRNSTRSTDFITPKSESSKILRDSVLILARHYEFARPLVNSGRLSVATHYDQSPLNTADEDTFDTVIRPGSYSPDAPITVAGKSDWLLKHLGGDFVALVFGDAPQNSIEVNGINVRVLQVGKDIEDSEGLLNKRFDGKPGTTYLLRPDQYIAARWRGFDTNKISQAVKKASN